MSQSTNEIAVALKRLLEEVDRDALVIRPAHFYDGLIYDYSHKVLSELEALLSSSSDVDILRETVKKYLASNWTWIKGSYLSYTSLPENEITTLFCEIAVLLSDERTPPLSLLMPDVCFEPTNMVRYPDLSLTYQTVNEIKQVLKTHILSESGSCLIPVSVLYQEDMLNPKPLPNVYFDIFSEAHEGESEEVLRDSSIINEEEYERLYAHSALTKRIGEAREQYLHLLEDKSNLLGQLTLLLNSLYFHSANGVGQETLSGVGVYTASQAFYTFYHGLEEDELARVPEKLIEELALLSSYFTGENEADMNSCFATRHNAIKSAMTGHASLLLSIGLTDRQRQCAMQDAKNQLDKSLSELKDSLGALKPTYQGNDTLSVTPKILETLNATLLFSKYEAISPLLNRLTARDISLLFQNELTQASLLKALDNFDYVSWLILDLPVKKLQVLLSTLGKQSVSGLLLADMYIFLNFISMLPDEKRDVVLDGVDIDYQDSDGNTALIWAVSRGHIEIATALIEKGACLNKRNNYNYNAIILAAWSGHKAIAVLLIDKGARLDEKAGHNYTTLMWAAQQGHKEIALALIEKGANLDEKNNDKNTALILATREGHKEIVLVLIEKGASLDETNNNNDTALILAVSLGHKEIAVALIEKGANLDLQNAQGDTALIQAVKQNNLEIAKALIKKGANLQVRNEQGDTALICAERGGHKDIVCLLNEKIASINDKNDANKRVLDLFRHNNAMAVEDISLLFQNTLTRRSFIEALPEFQQFCGLILSISTKKTHAVLSSFDKGWLSSWLLGDIKLLLNFVSILPDEKGDVFWEVLEVDCKDSNGDTLLIQAIKDGHPQIALKLIGKGANPREKNKCKYNEGYTPLMWTLRYGHTEIALKLIETKVALDEKDVCGETALMWCARNGIVRTAQALIDKGASLDEKDNFDDTALHKAIRERNTAIALSLIAMDANLDVKNKDGNTALIIASNLSDKKTVESLILHRANLDEKNDYGNTAVFYAVSEGRKDIVSLLIKNAASLEGIYAKGKSLLHLAIEKYHIHIAMMLIEKNLKLNLKDEDGNTPLLLAIKYGLPEVVLMLIEKGVNLDEENNQGHIPLLSVIKGGTPEGAIKLIESGAKIDVVDSSGSNALHLALMHPLLSEVALMLIDRGIDLEAKEKTGSTALIIASVTNQREVGFLLIDKKVDLEVKNKWGLNALHLAVSWGSTEIALALIDAGANLEETDEEGRTALMVAAHHGRIEIAGALIDKGANIEAKNKYGENALKIAKEYKAKEVVILLKTTKKEQSHLQPRHTFFSGLKKTMTSMNEAGRWRKRFGHK